MNAEQSRLEAARIKKAHWKKWGPYLSERQWGTVREGLIVYMGNDVWGVKWRNWKINFKEQETVFSETLTYGLPRVYNLHKDPGETQNVLFPETWVPKAALGQLGGHMISLKKEPPIKPGTKDPYEPKKP
jgi:hypothetical protein